MSFSKSHLFDPADQVTSAFARALSHPVRLDILRNLSKTKSLSVEDLSAKYPLAKSTISQHLEILRRIDLIIFKEEYPFIRYSLNTITFKKLNSHIQQYCQGI